MFDELKAAFLEHPPKLAAGYAAGFVFQNSGWLIMTTAVLGAYTAGHIIVRLVKSIFMK